MKRYEIMFGALADPISEELRRQGLRASKVNIAYWQRDAKAISRLSIRGLLTDDERGRARKRLLQRILANCAAVGQST